MHLNTVQKIRRICILNFTGTRQNWGCQATSWELLKFINSAFQPGSIPKVSFVPLLPRARVDEEIAERHLSSIYDAVEACSGKNPDPSSLAFLERLCLQRYGFWTEAVRAADLVIFQGEGTMTGTDFVRGARLLLLPFVAQQVWKKPVFSLNQTIFCCDPQFERMIAATFKIFPVNAVREPISLDAAKSMGLTNGMLIPDTAFLARPGNKSCLPHFQSHRPYFCVTGTAFPGEDAQEKIFALADAVRSQTDFIPVIAASTAADGKLEELARKAWKPNSYEIVPSSLYYPSATAALEKCAFLLGGRYHMAIMAAAMGTPSLLVQGNSYKNEGLAALLETSYPVRALEDRKGVIADATNLAMNLAEKRETLLRQRAAILHAIHLGRDWISSLIQGRTIENLAELEKPLGRPIRAKDHLEPYCAAAIAEAQLFKDAPGPKKPLGRMPKPEEILGPLVAGLEGDPTGCRVAIQQAFHSNPALWKTCGTTLLQEVRQSIAPSPLSAPSLLTRISEAIFQGRMRYR